jgi:hypothetical protein
MGRFAYPRAGRLNPRLTHGDKPSVVQIRVEVPIVTRFMFLVLERHRVVAPTSARSLAAAVPAL